MKDDGTTRSIRLSSSLHFDTLADYRAAGKGMVVLSGQTVQDVDNGYGLQGNATLQELQDAISQLEDGSYTLLYPSGSTALCALSALLKTGDHWLLPDSVYGPLRRFAEYLDEHYGVVCDYYDPVSPGSVESLIKPKTRIIHIETPASVTYEITAVEELVKLARRKKILTSADNTWASGVLYKPLDHGIDISILSLTKYVAGYSDVFMGSLTTKDRTLFKRFSYHHRVLGYSVSSFSAMLVKRGLESLEARLVAHANNASQLVQSIKDHPNVTKVHQALIEGQTNGLFSVELDRVYSDAELEKALAGLKIYKIGESWGGTRSLVLPFQPSELAKRATPPRHTIIRFHAGLENQELQQADVRKILEDLA